MALVKRIAVSSAPLAEILRLAIQIETSKRFSYCSLSAACRAACVRSEILQ